MKNQTYNQMTIETFPFLPIDSRMYLLIEGDQALVVDPCVAERALAALDDMRVKQLTILLTHEHYDHISGVNWLKQHYPSRVICSAACAACLTDDRKNMSRYYDALMLGMHRQKYSQKTQPYICEATDTFEEYDTLVWQGHVLEMRETPGHSPGSICIVMDGKFLFTGDTLLKEDKIITKLPGGNRRKYEEITRPWLTSLPEELHVCPGHGEGGLLKEFEI